METEDPLASLIVDAGEMDRQRIADALRGVIHIDRTGRVIPGEGFTPLAPAEKILAFLLGRKAAVLLELADSEAVGPTELAAQSGIPDGTVKRVVRELFNGRRVSQDVDNGYYLSPHQVGTAISRLAAPVDAKGTAGGAAPRTSGRGARKRAPKGAARHSTGKRRQDAGDDANGAGQALRKAKSGFSVTQAVRDLVAQGFFDSPKTLAAVQERLKEKQGRDIPQTTLSPIFTRLLRSGHLDRSRNSEGNYEYTASS